MPVRVNPRRVITVDDSGMVTRAPTSPRRAPVPPPRSVTMPARPNPQYVIPVDDDGNVVYTPNYAARSNHISTTEAVISVVLPESNGRQKLSRNRMAISETETLDVVWNAGGDDDFLFPRQREVWEDDTLDNRRQPRQKATHRKGKRNSQSPVSAKKQTRYRKLQGGGGIPDLPAWFQEARRLICDVLCEGPEGDRIVREFNALMRSLGNELRRARENPAMNATYSRIRDCREPGRDLCYALCANEPLDRADRGEGTHLHNGILTRWAQYFQNPLGLPDQTSHAHAYYDRAQPEFQRRLTNWNRGLCQEVNSTAAELTAEARNWENRALESAPQLASDDSWEPDYAPDPGVTLPDLGPLAAFGAAIIAAGGAALVLADDK